MQVPRQLRAENLTLHYLLLETKTVASPKSSMVSLLESENNDCMDRTSDVSQSYHLQETQTLASPQSSVVSQSENSGCLDRTSDVSQSSRYLNTEREVVGIAQVQSDLYKLSAEAAVEHSSILVDNCEDSEVVCTHCLIKGSQTALRRCTGCKSFNYCNKRLPDIRLALV